MIEPFKSIFREDFDFNNRIVKQQTVRIGKKKYFISTVDLGIDHSFNQSMPLYFETMIFLKGKNFSDLYMQRYSTKEEAFNGHKKIASDLINRLFVLKDGYLSYKEGVEE